MKKIAPIICIALALLLGCKASLSTRVKDECKKCKEMYKQGLCKDTLLKTITKTDSIVKSDSVKKSQELKANQDVINSGIAVFTECDSIRKENERLKEKMGTPTPKDDKVKADQEWNELKAIHSKNMDRKCPDIPPNSKVEMGNYYSEAGIKDGRWYHNIFQKEHTITVNTTTIEEPISYTECSVWDHWYFYAFLIESVIIGFFVFVAIVSTLKGNKS